MNPSDLLPWLSTILSIGTLVGGFFFAFRRGRDKEARSIEARVIAGLEKEVKVLRDKIEDLEKERATQDGIISTIRYALNQYQLKITIADGFVTLENQRGQRRITPIREHVNDEIDAS